MRFLTSALLVFGLLTATALPVSAGLEDGYIDNEQQDDGDVVLVVGSDGAVSQPAPAGGMLTCTLHDFEFQIEGFYGPEVAPTDELVESNYYWLFCRNAAGDLVVSRLFQYLPGVTIIDPAELARRARNELAVTYPQPRTSPAIGIDQLVGIDTWLWIDPVAWQPLTATAAIPGLSVSATATPEHVTWVMGDGETVVCDGPGTPFDETRSVADQSTDCSHLYQDAGDHTASVTITWSVTWSASDGSGGTLADVTRTTQFPVSVVERQAIGR